MGSPLLFVGPSGASPDPVFPDGVMCLAPNATADLAYNLDQNLAVPYQTVFYRHVDGVWIQAGQQTLQNNVCQASSSAPVPAYYTRDGGWPESPVSAGLSFLSVLAVVVFSLFLLKWVIHGVLKTL